MARITIGNLDDDIMPRLRARAAAHGRSMAEEVREILRTAVGGGPATIPLAASIRARVAGASWVALDLQEREAMRPALRFVRGR